MSRMTTDTGRLRELAKAALDGYYVNEFGIASSHTSHVTNGAYVAAMDPATVLSLCDAADRAVRLEAAATLVLDAYQVKGRPNEHLWAAVKALREAMKS